MSLLADQRVRVATCVALAIIVLDQVTKAIVEQTMQLHQSIELTPFVALTYVRNTGVHLPIGAGSSARSARSSAGRSGT